LGFKDDCKPWAHPLEEAPRSARQIKRHEPHLHRVAEQCRSTLFASGSCRSENDGYLRIARAQIEHQCRRRLHFARRYRVHPNARAVEPVAEAETLREVVPVARFTPAAPQYDDAQERNQQVGSGAVKNSKSRAHQACRA
jgi:hypothetical protein